MPSRRGIRMSMSTTSGCLAATASTASDPVGGLGDHLDVGRTAQDHPQSGAHEGVVVDEDDRGCGSLMPRHGSQARTTNSPRRSVPKVELAAGQDRALGHARSRPMPERGRPAPHRRRPGRGLLTVISRPVVRPARHGRAARAPGACLRALVRHSWMMRKALRDNGIRGGLEIVDRDAGVDGCARGRARRRSGLDGRRGSAAAARSTRTRPGRRRVAQHPQHLAQLGQRQVRVVADDAGRPAMVSSRSGRCGRRAPRSAWPPTRSGGPGRRASRGRCRRARWPGPRRPGWPAHARRSRPAPATRRRGRGGCRCSSRSRREGASSDHADPGSAGRPTGRRRSVEPPRREAGEHRDHCDQRDRPPAAVGREGDQGDERGPGQGREAAQNGRAAATGSG